MVDCALSEKIKVVNLFSILMVVLIHAYNLKDNFLLTGTLVEEGLHVSTFIQYFISNGLARFAVPLFFIISGYLFFINLEPSVKGFCRKIWKRFQSVYLIFLLWALISVLFSYVFEMWSVTHIAIIGGNDGMEVTGISLGQVLWNAFLEPPAEQYWFLRHLFRLVILSPLIYLLVKRLYIIALPIFMGIWFFDLQYIFNGVYWMNNEAVIFFMVGAFLGVHKVNLQWKPKKWQTNLCVVLWIILLSIKTYLATTQQNIGLNYMYKISELLGIASVWFVYDTYIANAKIKVQLLKVANYTFFIYLFHEPLQGMIRCLLRGNGEPTLNGLLAGYIGGAIISVAICLVLGVLLQCYLPSVYNFITGGRGKYKCATKTVMNSARA